MKTALVNITSCAKPIVSPETFWLHLDRNALHLFSFTFSKYDHPEKNRANHPHTLLRGPVFQLFLMALMNERLGLAVVFDSDVKL